MFRRDGLALGFWLAVEESHISLEGFLSSVAPFLAEGFHLCEKDGERREPCLDFDPAGPRWRARNARHSVREMVTENPRGSPTNSTRPPEGIAGVFT